MFKAPVGAEELREAAAHFMEHMRRRTLEREDRLFFIADREEGARIGPASETRGEFTRKLFENCPLRLARILGFIDENMVDAGIELEHHPTRVGTLQERDGTGDQIVEIEFAAHGLCGLIAGEDFADENHQSGRALETSGGLPFCPQDFKPRLFGFEVCEEIGTLFLEGLRRKRLSASHLY